MALAGRASSPDGRSISREKRNRKELNAAPSLCIQRRSGFLPVKKFSENFENPVRIDPLTAFIIMERDSMVIACQRSWRRPSAG